MASVRMVSASDGSCRRVREHLVVAIRCDWELNRRPSRIANLVSGKVKSRSFSGTQCCAAGGPAGPIKWPAVCVQRLVGASPEQLGE